MDENTAAMLKQLEFEDWFVDYLSRIHYMAPRALSILELQLFIALTYYKTHFPKQFENIVENENI